MTDGSDSTLATEETPRGEARPVGRSSRPQASALAKRYGRSRRLIAGKRVTFKDEDGDTFSGTIVEALSAEGVPVLRVQLDADPDADPTEEAEAPIVEVNACNCKATRAKS